MGIDADFKFNIPVDADFPDSVVIERDSGDTREYIHPDILHATEDSLGTALGVISELICLNDLKDRLEKEWWERAQMILKAENYERVNPLQKGGNDSES